jgi:hypothetical protein
MIVLRGALPPRHIVAFFEGIIPGFWGRWLSAATWALREIDADVGGETVITSWYRSPSQNVAASGAEDSQHLFGLALDVVPGKGSLQLAINEAAGRFREAGFVVAPAPRHLHVQTFPAGLLRSAGVFDVIEV